MKLRYDVTGLKVSAKQQKMLAPYLIGERPDANGEWYMHCPLHKDDKRSASLNVVKGVWTCFGSCGSGRVSSLIKMKDQWVDPPNGAAREGKRGGSSARVDPDDLPTEARVAGWASALLSNPEKLRALKEARGLSTETLQRFQIGWDSRGAGSYRIPIRSAEGGFWNCRHYDLNPSDVRRKIWSVNGMGSPRLYPIQVLDTDPDEIIICEGEWDALILNQCGFVAITRTGAAKIWSREWSEKFRDKVVYLAHDADETGQAANNALIVHLTGIAREIRVVKWPWPIEEKHGKDVTDFIKEFGPEDFKTLLRRSEIVYSTGIGDPEDIDTSEVGVVDTFDARRVGKPSRWTTQIQGRTEPGYSIPREASFMCPQDFGPETCKKCPIFSTGRTDVKIEHHEEINLELVDANNKSIMSVLKERCGIPNKCNRVRLQIHKHRSVEILHSRPPVGIGNDVPSSFRGRRIISIGRHDTPSNSLVRVTGALLPNPKNQQNEFLAWGIEEQETSLDQFRMTDEIAEQLSIFRPKRGQSPLSKAVEIARDLSQHVTKIVGRDEMHVFMDLVWHSMLAYEFDGQMIDNGRVEGLIVGDTRTGKSEVAKRLKEHYRSGEMISGESASFAGIIGGLQQHGGTSEWTVNWGAYPLNDRGMLIIDEIGGLSTDDIAQMSSSRSSGTAELTKIRSERTMARTRGLMLGNPRSGTLSDYSYAIDVLPGLIGNAEDIARFTFAMAAKRNPELSSAINAPRVDGDLRYGSDACRMLVLWAWSRASNQVSFSPGAVRTVYSESRVLGKRYVENPPLIQAANVRIKLASLAASLAARTFSTTDDFEKVLVKSQHVRDVVKFLDRIYYIDDFGYRQRSKEILADEKFAKEHVSDTRKYLRNKKGLIKFLRSQGRFKRQDIEEITGLRRDEANAIINHLHDLRMVRKESGFVIVAPVLHELLRETDV